MLPADGSSAVEFCKPATTATAGWIVEVAATDHDIAYWLASAYLLQGQKDEALKWLGNAIKLGNENYRWFRADPNWTTMHDDARFVELTQQTKAD